MTIEIDKTEATKILNESYKNCLKISTTDCLIKDTIDFVLNGKNCLTYRYIMISAILAKSINTNIDILSLQAGDKTTGAYDARSLASKVIFPFQKKMLGNIIDGANSDPLVNKPGRFLRLDKENSAAAGDPSLALDALCDNLPKIQTSQEARKCIDYIISTLIEQKAVRDTQQALYDHTIRNASIFNVYTFLNDLLNQGFGGTALVLVTTALYHIQFPEELYKVKAHPANQSGSSKRQFSDLDLYRDEKPFMGTELKDKPYSSSDIDHAAETAYKAGASSLLFVAGRQSNFASQPPTYFNEARAKYANKGMFVGVTSIDSLMDTIISGHPEMNAAHILQIVCNTAEDIGALEAQMWIYGYMSKESN